MISPKDKARRVVRSAISSGVLVRPSACTKCGEIPKPMADGRATIQAHHHDYSKPLEVEWICVKCHRKETPLPIAMGAPVFGEANGQSKLTYQQVKEIRESPIGCVRLSRIYGVDKSTITAIRSGRYWRETQPQQEVGHE